VVVLGPDGQSPLSNISQIVVGYTHTCALLNDSTAVCWGEGRHGQLGNALSAVVDSSDLSLSVLDNQGAAMAGITELDAGWGFTCALLADSTVQCFGSGAHGERGDGLDGDTHYGPVPNSVLDSSSQQLSGIAALSAGFRALCLRSRLNAATCAGSNLHTYVYGSSESLPSAIHW